MGTVNTGITDRLLALAEDKLSYLHTLKNSLIWLCANIETSVEEVILQQIDLQNECLAIIIHIDQQYQTFTKGNNKVTGADHVSAQMLETKLVAQNQILTEIKVLNHTATEKAQRICALAKDNLIKANQQENALSYYTPIEGHQTGLLLDYKE
ncbi:MAG: hypothetical protein PHN35_03535 [Clostridia bacterium]|nr:hypothetical protein [Clostridia bacterium]MDD4798287.1 hypothetical protein [Clostridia bacterium]